MRVIIKSLVGVYVVKSLSMHAKYYIKSIVGSFRDIVMNQSVVFHFKFIDKSFPLIEVYLKLPDLRYSLEICCTNSREQSRGH